MTDYYQVLGVAADATDEEVKAAYRKAALEHHPDKGGDAERFREVQEAYEALRDDESRSHYQRTGEANSKATERRRRAERELSEIFTAIAVGVEDLAHVDVVALAGEKLREALRQVVNAGFTARADAGRFRNAAARCKARRGAENLPAAVFRRMAEQAEVLADAKDEGVATIKEMLAMLEGFSYKVDADVKPDLSAVPWWHEQKFYTR